MSSRNRIVPLLESYLHLPPEASLLLLTSTLGCSINWLTVRFAGSHLGPSDAPASGDGTTASDPDAAVVLVSWMRDEAFWRSELRRAEGLDISKLATDKRFAFVDCFTSTPRPSPPSPNSVPATLLAEAEAKIESALSQVQNRTILLILDNPDVLLALGSTHATALSDFVLRLRARVQEAVLICSADHPFTAAAAASTSSSTAPESNPTPIETETAAFLVSQAHLSRFVISARELATGAARDVSGVLRITRGGDSYAWRNGDEGEEGGGARPAEVLYHVSRDGGVKVFERGAGGT